MSNRWQFNSLTETQRWDRRHVALAALVALSVALAGCMVGPDYKRPPLETPGSFKSSLDPARDDPERAEGSRAEKRDAPLIAPEWWRLYREPELDRLVAMATASNQTLKQAVAAVDQARALARVAASYLAPTISTAPTFTRQRTSANRKSTFTGQPVGIAATVNDWLVPVDLTYELDVWGGIRRGLQSARAQVVASADDEAMVRLTVQTDVAQVLLRASLPRQPGRYPDADRCLVSRAGANLVRSSQDGAHEPNRVGASRGPAAVDSRAATGRRARPRR